MANLTNSQEPGVFGSLEPEPDRLKKTGAGAAWEKNQEPEPLVKKSGAGAGKKFAGSPALLFFHFYRRFLAWPINLLNNNYQRC